MAEFCLECWNKINHTKDAKWMYVMSGELDYCEECQQSKEVIVRTRITYDLVQFIRNHHKK